MANELNIQWEHLPWQQWAEWQFNGGKMYHFTSDTDTNSEEATQAIHHGKLGLKVHGECVALVNENDNWVFHQRYDVGSKMKKGDEIPLDCINLYDTETMEQDVYNEGGKPHYYLWKRIAIDPTKSVKKLDQHTKNVIETMKWVEKAMENNLFPKPCEWSRKYITCEWIGIKHQANADHIERNHALYPHGSTMILWKENERTFENLIKFAENYTIEGLICQHPETKKLYKCRFDQISKKNKFETNYREHGTDIRPFFV